MVVRRRSTSPDPFETLGPLMDKKGKNFRRFHDHACAVLARPYRKAFGFAMQSIGDRVLDLTPFLFGLLVHHRLSLESVDVPNEVHIVTPSERAKTLIERFVGSAPRAKGVDLKVDKINKLLDFIQLTDVYGHFDTVLVADLFFLLDQDQRREFLTFIYDALAKNGKLVLLDLFTAVGNPAALGGITLVPSHFIPQNGSIHRAVDGLTHQLSFAELHHEIATSGLFEKSVPHGVTNFGSTTFGDYRVLHSTYSYIPNPSGATSP